MVQLLKTRWELFIVLAIFIAFRVSALHYPFYWDESWSYAPGVKLMYLHGPSLMPNAIDTFYSRGHPLLFYASAAAWMRLFGDSHIAQHSFCLFISILLIISVYEISLKMFSKRAATISLLWLPLQVMFYVQSTLLLPEVMVGLGALLTLYFYSKGKYFITFICCSALLLTKESGMVMGLVLGIHAAINLFNKKESHRSRLKNFAAVFFAGLIIALFYLLQKKLNGWYLFPQHTGLIEWDWHTFWDKFRYSLDVLFGIDFKFRIFEFLLLLSAITAIHSKNIRYTIPVLAALCIYESIVPTHLWIPRKLLFALVLISLLITAYQLIVLAANKSTPRKKMIFLTTFFLIAYLLFSGINFFTPRYLIAPLIIVIILSAAWFDLLIASLHKSFFYIILAVIIIVSGYGFYANTGLGDISLGTFDGMTVEQNVVDYLEKENFYDKNIAASSFQSREHLTKPYTGFLHDNKVFKNVVWEITPHTSLIIFDNIEPDDRYNDVKKDSSLYQRIYRTEKGQAWTEVYERIK